MERSKKASKGRGHLNPIFKTDEAGRNRVLVRATSLSKDRSLPTYTPSLCDFPDASCSLFHAHSSVSFIGFSSSSIVPMVSSSFFQSTFSFMAILSPPTLSNFYLHTNVSQISLTMTSLISLRPFQITTIHLNRVSQ